MIAGSTNQDFQAKLDRLYIEVIQELENRANPQMLESIKSFHKGGEILAYGLRSADIDLVCRQFRQKFKALSLDELLQLARRFYHSRNLSQGSIGKSLLMLSIDQLDPGHFDLLDTFLDDFTSWGTTDSFCVDVLQPLLKTYPEEVLELVSRWNRSDNPWKRRASVVLFTRQIGSSGEYTRQALELCENLIWDEHDLVQKGVGWALKDCMHGDKEPILAYVKELRCLGVPSTITLYAIRDLKGQERQDILAIKPSRRGKKR